MNFKSDLLPLSPNQYHANLKHPQFNISNNQTPIDLAEIMIQDPENAHFKSEVADDQPQVLSKHMPIPRLPKRNTIMSIDNPSIEQVDMRYMSQAMEKGRNNSIASQMNRQESGYIKNQKEMRVRKTMLDQQMSNERLY